jgi:hypothetical protein
LLPPNAEKTFLVDGIYCDKAYFKTQYIVCQEKISELNYCFYSAALLVLGAGRFAANAGRFVATEDGFLKGTWGFWMAE